MSTQFGVVQRPKPGNVVSGDAWCACERDGRLLVCLADGLGSGPAANLAAVRVIETVRAYPAEALPDLLARCHQALLGTRGAAAALFEVTPGLRHVAFAGVGNVEARTRREWAFHPISLRGIVGANNFRAPRVYEAEYEPGEWLVLHTDGLRSRFDLELELVRAAHTGVLAGGPQALADLLAADHGRETDDLTVVVLQLN